MDTFEAYLNQIENLSNRQRTAEVLNWTAEHFPELQKRIAWNQPMFTDHGTFIIGFSVSKAHLAVAPERAAIQRFSGDILLSGYNHGKELLRIQWNQPVDYGLLEKIIRFNLLDKADCPSFWRKDGQ